MYKGIKLTITDENSKAANLFRTGDSIHLKPTNKMLHFENQHNSYH